MLTRKREMRAKLEKIEGSADDGSGALTDGDAFLALDPSVNPSREKIEIPGIGKSLSKEISQFGFPSGQLSFQVLLRGSRVAPVTVEPEWALHMKACGMQATELAYLVMDAGASGTFVHGESLSFAGSGATAKAIGTTTAGDGVRLYYELTSGTPVDSDTVTGGTSSASCSITTGNEAVAGGYKYTPDSVVATSMGVSAWSSGDPSPGDVIKKSGASSVFGVVVSYDSANDLLYYVPVWDDFAQADGVELVTGSNTGSTTTVGESGPSQVRTPSISLEDRVDGLRRLFTGCRGTWSLALQAGQPARFQFEFQGIHSAEDTVPLGSPTLTTADGLIFRNARLKVDELPMKLAAYELALAAQTAPRLDPSAPKGALSYRLTDRAPTLRIDPERVMPGVYDFDAKWDASATFATVAELGSSEGNRVILETPKAHIAEMSDADRDGLLASDINCDLTARRHGRRRARDLRGLRRGACQ